MKEKSKEYFEFKKQLKQLKKVKGQGTELISLYITPGSNVAEVSGRLKDEYGQAMNIKSKQTRKNVQAAIDKIVGMLKGVNKPPENGVAIFCGNVNDSIELFNIIPPEPLGVSMYRCSSQFVLDPLEELTAPKESYGLFVMDRREATIALLKGKKIKILRHKTSNVPGKHHKGGQSAMRFTRLIEQAAHEFYKRIADEINKSFSGKEVKGIIAGGPGGTKFDLIKAGYLHNDIKEKIIGTLDTSYTDEFGITELMQKSGDIISKLEVIHEKELTNKFLKAAVTDGLATYGKTQVREAIQAGQVDTLLLSEEMDEKEIDEFTELAEQTDVKVEMISTDTPEGEQFFQGFGGIGALLRFK